MKTFQPIILSLILFLFSCSSNKSEKKDFSSADSVSEYGTTGDAQKLVKTTSIDFKVRDVYQTAKDVRGIARKAGGMVTHYNITSSEENSRKLPLSDDSLLVITSYVTNAEMTVRIPAVDLDEFMGEISSRASFIHSTSLDIDDKSLDYLENRLKQNNREQVLKGSGTASLKPSEKEEVINQKNQGVEELINNRRTDALVKYSTVSLSFYQNALITKETIVNNDLSRYTAPFPNSMVHAFYNGWDIFLSFIIGITNLWMFILLGILIIVCYKYYKRNLFRLHSSKLPFRR